MIIFYTRARTETDAGEEREAHGYHQCARETHFKGQAAEKANPTRGKVVSASQGLYYSSVLRVSSFGTAGSPRKQ